MAVCRVVYVLQFQDGLFLGPEGNPVVSLRYAIRYPDPDNLIDTARYDSPGQSFELHRLYEVIE